MRRNIFYALALVSLAAALAAQPEPSRAEDSSRFGAIAFSLSTRMYGYVFDYADKESARSGAIEECKEEAGAKDCKAVVHHYGKVQITQSCSIFPSSTCIFQKKNHKFSGAPEGTFDWTIRSLAG